MRTIRIGGASGFWGESDMALPQFLRAGALDYIVFDYLAEVTMSIMARARAKDPQAGYATDFVTAVMRPHIAAIAASGVKIIANAGGVNPMACADAVRAVVAEAGLKLKVAVVTGDDLLDKLDTIGDIREMFAGDPLPPRERIASANAYLGAFPIAQALGAGADIVITGRCVDSAVTLGACIHAFGWGRGDVDRLAAASLAGHILECGPQATGGNFTDWARVVDTLTEVGYPIAEISASGAVVITKPEGTGGTVTVATVGEQMLYEIGDPQAYALPDVVCDFSGVVIEALGPDRVRLTGARGYPAPDRYKVSLTWADGCRVGTLWFFIGEDAAAKARAFADGALTRARAKLRGANAPDFDEVLVEISGDESQYGRFARPEAASVREVTLKVAAKHRDMRGAALLLKEATGMALAAPPGLTVFSGGRPRPSPVVRLFSFLVNKKEAPVQVDCDGRMLAVEEESGQPFDPADISRPVLPVIHGVAVQHDDPGEAPSASSQTSGLIEVPLFRLAYGRSGDKGNKANIGLLPRHADYIPWIWGAVTEGAVQERFAHFLKGRVERFYMPGTGAINLVLHDVLGGGGVASLRNDPQGKSYAQILLAMPIAIPEALAGQAVRAQSPVTQTPVAQTPVPHAPAETLT